MKDLHALLKSDPRRLAEALLFMVTEGDKKSLKILADSFSPPLVAGERAKCQLVNQALLCVTYLEATNGYTARIMPEDLDILETFTLGES